MPQATVDSLAQALNLSVIDGHKWLDRKVTTADIHRPALEMAGFFAHYPAQRIQVFGQTEVEFFSGLDKSLQRIRAIQLVGSQTPCFIFSRDLPAPEAISQVAQANQIPLLGTGLTTTRLVSNLAHWLDNVLAPRKTIHGVFVELFGVGVLLTGRSGIGKSETALELIKRGHRLVADDAVEIRRPAEDVLVGTSPGVLANLMELRGVGIIDVCKLFGASAVRPDKRVELILHFERWKEGDHYERLGFDTTYQEMLEVKVPIITVPVAPGRNLAMIVETAAVNFRAKSMGVDAGQDITERITKEMAKNQG